MRGQLTDEKDGTIKIGSEVGIKWYLIFQGTAPNNRWMQVLPTPSSLPDASVNRPADTTTKHSSPIPQKPLTGGAKASAHSRQAQHATAPTPPPRVRPSTASATAARRTGKYNLGDIGWLLANDKVPDKPALANIWTCPETDCPCSVSSNMGDKEGSPDEQEELMIIEAHLHAHTEHGKLFTQPHSGGQWRTLPKDVQIALIERCIATWGVTLRSEGQPIEIRRFSFTPPGATERSHMYGLFATRTIPSKTRLKGNYTGEAITKEQLAFRTKTADKIMQINGALVDGTDPRFATW